MIIGDNATKSLGRNRMGIFRLARRDAARLFPEICDWGFNPAVNG